MRTVGAVIGGFFLLVIGVVVVLPAPELGLPLILVGLRLLGRKFAWARAANAQVDRFARWLKRKVDRLPLVVKVLGAIGLAAAVGLLVWWWIFS